MAGSGPPTQTLEERYGKPTTHGRWRGAVLVSLAVAVLAAWAIWAALGHNGPSVTGVVESYDVRSPHAMAVTVQVSREPSATVRCLVNALASDHTEVGRAVVIIRSGGPEVLSRTVTVRTERTATTADVVRCHQTSSR